MGQPKAMLAVPGGMSLLAWQCLQLHDFMDVVVVSGALALPEDLPPPARVIRHAGWQAGRQSSLAAAARALHAPGQAVLVAAVDQPLTPRVVEALLTAAGDAPDIAIVPTHEERGGHPVLLPARLHGALCGLEAEPEGLRSLLRREGSMRLPLPYPEITLDLNHPEDWARALASGLWTVGNDALTSKENP
jgi:CTP:molybdopterin cytidylyltransferase MocA